MPYSETGFQVMLVVILGTFSVVPASLDLEQIRPKIGP